MRSLIICKKEELFDQLLNSIEEKISGLGDSFHPQDWPFWIIITNYARDSWEEHGPISPQDKIKLTRPFRKDERPRLIDPGRCRDWAIEDISNWMRIIPEGKEMLLECAREHKNDQFLQAVERFERLAKKERARKDK
jgi:hypothetical protein